MRSTFSKQAKTRHLIVISVDALNAKDLPQIQELPNFCRLLAEGAYAREVAGIYPSLTYPAHATIITGTYPDKHGIINNEIFQPGAAECDWYWFAKDIRVPTLPELARRQKLRVGSLLWPVMGKAGINFNLPEIKAKAGENQSLVVLRSGTPFFLLNLELRYGRLRRGICQPELDNFVTAAAKHLIISKRPNLLLIHLTDTDEQRHLAGSNSSEARKSLVRQDQRLGEIIEAAKAAGIYNQTTFAVLGDHGFLDVQKQINLNAEFVRKGLASIDAQGRLTAWQALLHSAEGSAYIYLRDKDDEVTRRQVAEILRSLVKNPDSGIEKIYHRQELELLRVGSEAEFMLEAREGFSFTNELTGELVREVRPGRKPDGSKVAVATHGYSPEKPDYFTFFLMAGPGVRKGAVLERINLVDEGPTLAALLGIELPAADGRVLHELLDSFL